MIKRQEKGRIKAKVRIRKKISGTTERPRMSIFRSLNQIYVQFVDDASGKTILGVSSKSKDLQDQIGSAKNKVEKSKIVGKYAAEKALEKNIQNVVFDRNGFRYHGRVKAVADGAREAGLKF